MANPVCTTAGLISPCFQGSVINAHQRLALMVWFMALQLKGVGGTDYTVAPTSTASGKLLGDANSLAGTMTLDQLANAELTIYALNAIASGATTAEAINVRIQEVKCLENCTDPQLEEMYILLLCKLGISKAYPQ